MTTERRCTSQTDDQNSLRRIAKLLPAMSCLLVVSYAEPGSSLLNLLIVRERKITFKKKKKKNKRKKTIVTFIML